MNNTPAKTGFFNLTVLILKPNLDSMLSHSEGGLKWLLDKGYNILSDKQLAQYR